MKREDTRYKGVFDEGFRAGATEAPEWDGRVKLLVALSIGLTLAAFNAMLNGSIMAGFLLVSAVVAFVGALIAWPR